MNNIFKHKAFFRLLGFLFIFHFSFFHFSFANPPERPRLVVGIMIDGLQHNHINDLQEHFVTGGLNVIFENSTVLKQVRYNIVSAGNASDVATIMTGTTPNFHGVAGNQFFNRRAAQEESILHDPNEVGIGTSHRFSAHRLLASTLTDELVLATNNRSRTHVVAIDPETAIMMGGHTARSVSWIDDVFTRWVTTGYYVGGLSRHADRMNADGSFRRIADTRWTPLHSTNTYSWNFDGTSRSFSHQPSTRRERSASQTILRTTPSANTLVTELAAELIREERLGRGTHTDMLMLQYTVRTPNELFTAVRSIEKEDMYLRLDREIRRLLDRIRTDVGIENTLFFVFGNNSSTHTPLELGENRIPSGYFNAHRSIALLSTFLMAIYGQERWVLGYSSRNIFLNRRLIEERNLSLQEVQQVVADFMIEFEGIRTAYTAHQIQIQPQSTDRAAVNVRNSHHKLSGGDVVISLLPGWLEVDNQNNPVGEIMSNNSQIPVFFYGWRMKRQQINALHYITDLAPTLSRLMGIPTPNASIGNVIETIIP